MKVAIVGSRSFTLEYYHDILQNIPIGCSEIVSGGADGIDQLAKKIAESNSIKLTEILPDYAKYGKKAPIVRNILIVDSCDYVLAFWDGKSKGTQHVICYCLKIQKPVKIIMLKKKDEN